VSDRKGYCKANDLCEGFDGVRGLCSWHLYRANLIPRMENTIRFYEGEDMGDHIGCKSARNRLARYREEMKLPKPTEPRKSGRKAAVKPYVALKQAKPKAALKGTVRRAVDLFLQSPSIETANDAKIAIDRYMSSR